MMMYEIIVTVTNNFHFVLIISPLKCSGGCVPDYEKEDMQREILPEIVSSLAVFQITSRKACRENSYQR